MCAGLLGSGHSLTSQEIFASDVLSTMVRLLASTQRKRKRTLYRKAKLPPIMLTH